VHATQFCLIGDAWYNGVLNLRFWNLKSEVTLSKWNALSWSRFLTPRVLLLLCVIGAIGCERRYLSGGWVWVEPRTAESSGTRESWLKGKKGQVARRSNRHLHLRSVILVLARTTGGFARDKGETGSATWMRARSVEASQLILALEGRKHIDKFLEPTRTKRRREITKKKSRIT